MFIPGKIYSFLYSTKNKPGKDRPTINRRPILLSMGQMVNDKGKIFEIGIDLMLVPPMVRVVILDNVYKYFKKDISENMTNLNEGRKGKKKLSLTYDVAKKVFNKTGWQLAFCTFGKENVTRPLIYDYEDWVTTISLDTKSIEGRQIKETFQIYIKKMSAALDNDLSGFKN